MKTRTLFRLLALLSAPLALSAAPLVKSGESIAFLGDSITQQGANEPSGYVRQVIAGLKAVGVEATAIPAGISGHKSNDMLARLQKDVIDKKPAWMTLSCGVNDVWHGERGKGVKLEDYKTNITAIVDQSHAAGIKVVILTATPIKEQLDNELNQQLAPYNAFLRELAAARKLPLADLNADFHAALATAPYWSNPDLPRLTGDGVHMNPLGNEVMALGVLRALGLDRGELERAREALQTNPATTKVGASTALSLEDYKRLAALSRARKVGLGDMLNAEYAKAVDRLLEEAK